MKKYMYLLMLMSSVLLSAQSQDIRKAIEELKPELFLPGKVTTGDFEYGSALSSDGKTFVYIKGIQGFQRARLVYIIQGENGDWSEPKLIPFSGTLYDTNPYFSHDSKRLYFVSARTSPDESHQRRNLWYTEFNDGQFGEPKIEATFNNSYDVIYPTIDGQGVIRYCTFRQDGKGGLDLYEVRLGDNGYGEHIPIDELNTNVNDADPEVSPNGNLLVYTSMRPGGQGHFDLYISRREGDSWGEPINLSSLNSPFMDSDPIFSKDGKYLFFSSNRVFNEKTEYNNYEELANSIRSYDNGLMNIFRVNVEELTSLFDN